MRFTRHIKAAPGAVYDAWTKSEQLRLWAGDRVEADARIGGAYRFENRDGGEVHVHTGEYLILEPDRRVRMSFHAGPDHPTPTNNYRNEFIEAALESRPDGCTAMVFTNGWDGDALDPEGMESLRTAWSGWLDRLDSAVVAIPDKETNQ